MSRLVPNKRFVCLYFHMIQMMMEVMCTYKIVCLEHNGINTSPPYLMATKQHLRVSKLECWNTWRGQSGRVRALVCIRIKCMDRNKLRICCGYPLECMDGSKLRHFCCNYPLECMEGNKLRLFCYDYPLECMDGNKSRLLLWLPP